MKKRVFKKEILDEIGANLLKATQTTDLEIENIVSKPQLFDLVVARIKAEESDHRQKRFHGRRRIWLNSAAAAAAIVLMIAAIVFYNHSNNSLENRLTQNESSVKPQNAEFSDKQTFLSLPATEPKSIVKTTAQLTNNARQKLNSNRRRKPLKSRRTSNSSPVPNVLPVEETYADGEKFYALPFADNSADDSITRIVRAELSRAELSALGIEFPFSENENERILTDLIYGANGNPKAFRLIGKF